jgi:hypothetical protein
LHVVLVPEQAPDQPANGNPVAAVAVSVTWAPFPKLAVQVCGQLMPAGELVTVPVPWPAKLTDSWPGGSVNDAPTVVFAFKSTLQVPVPEHAPDQPLNVAPALGVAVSTTLVPELNDALHVAPQLIPAGLLVTVPFPLPDSFTVSCTGGWLTPWQPIRAASNNAETAHSKKRTE